METDTEWEDVDYEVQLKDNKKKRPERVEDFNEKIPP
jgi:hypothetical protein